jgi:N4-gp56 family major capsid protein
LSTQVFTTSNPLTVKQWSEGLEAEALKKISYAGLIGKRSENLIQWKDTMSTKPGDEETIGLRMQLTAAPKDSSVAVEGSEQTLTIHDDKFTIEEYADAVRFKNVIDRQRVTFDMRDEARAALADQLANALDVSFFNQIGGNDITGLATTFSGHNTPLAPSTNRWFLAKASATEAVVDGDNTAIFTLDHVDLCVEQAKLATPTIRPANVDGWPEPCYVMFLHPWQANSLRTQDSRWDVTMQNAIRGGLINSNPLLTGAMGVWNGTLLIESSRVPAGINVAGDTELANTKRAIFCGAQSAVLGWGRIGGNPERFRWVEKMFDFDREYGVMAACLAGIKKLQFNSEDFGTIVVSTYAAALVP